MRVDGPWRPDCLDVSGALGFLGSLGLDLAYLRSCAYPHAGLYGAAASRATSDVKLVSDDRCGRG